MGLGLSTPLGGSLHPLPQGPALGVRGDIGNAAQPGARRPGRAHGDRLVSFGGAIWVNAEEV